MARKIMIISRFIYTGKTVYNFVVGMWLQYMQLFIKITRNRSSANEC